MPHDHVRSRLGGALVAFGLVLAAVSVLADRAGAADAPASPDWSMNATIIEACSCPMFCQCYFNPQPAAHASETAGHEHGEEAGHGHGGGDHFCRFNNAFKVNKGSYGKVSLAGAKFWVAGDLGGDFSQGQMDWAELTFDPAVTPEQREGIQAILGAVYPVKWNAFTVAADAAMDWTASKDRAEARLDGGKAAEVVLKRYPGNTDAPIVIQNLKYWGTKRNDGFVLMPNEVEAYRVGSKPFEFKGTNGFMITFDINSKDMMAAK
jgi:hypothetical protein